jgi:Chain length determinant protein
MEEEQEISLLDLMLIIAENIKLLILGPIAVGLIALMGSFFLPQSFTSQAILTLPVSASVQTPAQAASIMTSPLVLDPVIKELGLASASTIEVARNKLANQTKALAGKEGLLRLEVTARTPLEAQSIANLTIDAWLKSTLPGEQDRADLEKRLEYAQISLASVRRLMDRLTTEDVASLNKPLTRGEVGTSFVAVGELQARYLNEVLNLPRALKGLSRDVVVQLPTLPAESTGPKKGIIAIIVTLVSGIFMLLGVFVGQAWKNASKNPDTAKKQARLLASVGLKKTVVLDG